MKKFFSLILVSVLVSILQVPSALAVSFQYGDNLVINKDLNDDAYVSAANANISANVLGDLYIAGGNVTISGNVSEDLVVLGGRVTVLGDVGGDLRLVGGQVAVFGNVGDDVVAGAGQVDIGRDSIVEGSVLSSAGLLTVDGVVRGDVRGNMGLLILNGQVVGNVVVAIQDNISFSDGSKIGGNLEYSALVESKIPEGLVAGSVKFNQFDKDSLLESFTYLLLIEKILSFMAALLLAVLLVLFAPNMLIQGAEVAKENVFRAFVIGLFTLIGAFIGSIALMVSIIGIPVAMILLASLLIVSYLSKVFVVAWGASYFLKLKKGVSKIRLFGILFLGLIGYYLISFIPKVGWLIVFVLFLIGVGSIIQLEGKLFKYLKSKKMI